MTTLAWPHARATWIDPRSGATLGHAGLMNAMAGQQAVLLGETHDIAEIHRWQLWVATCLHLLEPRMAVGFEMFPRRVQPVLDRWVAGELATAAFLAEVDWPAVWGSDPAIYLPLFHFCRQQNVRMLALNCERPLVTRIGRDGWESVAEAERDGMSPAAPALPGHRAYIGRLTGRAEHEVTDRFLRAQMVWDRAFACNIAAALAAAPTSPRLVVGIIGRGHLEYGYGTPHQLGTLGVSRSAVLLPSAEASLEPAAVAGIGAAIFRIDMPDPPTPRTAAAPG